MTTALMPSPPPHPGCICDFGSSPVCPAPVHRPRRIVVSGVRTLPVPGEPVVSIDPTPVTLQVPQPGLLERLLMRIRILAPLADSERYSRVDAELDLLEAWRKSHQAHPVMSGLDLSFDEAMAVALNSRRVVDAVADDSGVRRDAIAG